MGQGPDSMHNKEHRHPEPARGAAGIASKAIWLVAAIVVLGGLAFLASRNYFAIHEFLGLPWNAITSPSGRHYIVFHTLVELFAVAVSIAILLVAWNVRRRMDNDFLLFIAIAYAAIALLDLIHTMAYHGLGVIPGLSTDPPTQLWIAARYFQAVCLLIAPLWLTRRLPLGATMAIMAMIDAAVLLSIFRPWPWVPAFPACHLGAAGLTPFKVASEYIICGILLAAVAFMWLRRGRLDRDVFVYMAASMLVTMASEVALTRYVSVQGPANMIGHLLKVVAVFLAYKALVEAGLRRPFDVLFRDLKQSEERYRLLFNGMTEGFALHEIICDDSGKPVDYRFVDINTAFEQFTGLKRETTVGRTVLDVLPDTDPVWIQDYGQVALTGRSIQFDRYFPPLGKHFEIYAYCPTPGQFAVVFFDITRRKQTEESLQRTAVELERSNKDLQQFAYIASHDLQEPLRMVSGFLQLLRQRFGKELDPQADEYIDFAVDGANRMSALISDLLEYSRVQSKGRQPAPTDMKAAFDHAVANCLMAIQETKAQVTHDDLPTVVGDGGQLAQLLQNLIANAIKFRRPDVVPEVHVGARREDNHWLMWVKDNGIGIPDNQTERVFHIFQRLHTRDKYPGTGIGLAICKKIVERHGGRIWVESADGGGSQFLFTIPAQ